MASDGSHTDGLGGGTSTAKEKLASFRKFASTSYTRARQVSLMLFNQYFILNSILFRVYCFVNESLYLSDYFSMRRSDWVRLK